jgi:hypothetical protein
MEEQGARESSLRLEMDRSFPERCRAEKTNVIRVNVEVVISETCTWRIVILYHILYVYHHGKGRTGNRTAQGNLIVLRSIL